jgi:hypothetical protein
MTEEIIDDDILEAELADDALEKKMRKLESVPRHPHSLRSGDSSARKFQCTSFLKFKSRYCVPGIPRISSISSANAG